MSEIRKVPPRVIQFGLGFLAASALAAVYFAVQSERREDALSVREQNQVVVREEFEPVRAALQAAAVVERPYDIEATMRVVRELDLAVQRSASTRDYFEALRRTDYSRAAPKVLAARQRILDVLVKYYGAVEKRNQEDELWQVFGRWSDELSKLLQAADVRAATPFGQVSLSPSDPARQRILLEERQRREEQRRETFAELVQFEEELLLALDASVPVFREVEDEWMRLCAQRDRAYLQTFELDYGQAAISAQAALSMAPNDAESMLLLALAQIEGETEVVLGEKSLGTDALLDAVLHDHPDNAPALLLRGLANVKRGRLAEARNELELSMTRYPEQAERLRDELDPYRKREYLRKTRQGGRITGLYRSMMLGASWFSPELQTARLDMQTGAKERALQHVKDHFARRRAQGQWDLILYDLAFCENLLGDLYREVFPEKSYLDLRITRNTFGSDVDIEIVNRSDVALHNAALVLAVRFTDMVTDEYAPFTAGKTQPVIAPLASTNFGGLDLSYDGLGAKKTVDDVVPPIRAVLVSDEAVCWIDSIEYKNERAVRRGTAGETTDSGSSWSSRVQAVIDQLTPEDVSLERVKKLITPDDLSVELPREIMWLEPLFRLETGTESFDEARGGAVRHRIEDGKVRVTFEKVGKALDGSPQTLRLVARSPFGDVVLILERNEAGNYVFSRVEAR